MPCFLNARNPLSAGYLGVFLRPYATHCPGGLNQLRPISPERANWVNDVKNKQAADVLLPSAPVGGAHAA